MLMHVDGGLLARFSHLTKSRIDDYHFRNSVLPLFRHAYKLMNYLSELSDV